MPGWGNVFGKIADWFPGRRESTQNTIDRLVRENAELQKKGELSLVDSARYIRNADRIKLLRTQEGRIT